MKKHWYDYLWIASLLYLLLGFFNILFAWLGLLCFFIPLIISVVSGTKSYCNRYCGRGQLFGLLGGRFGLSRRKDIPKWMKSKAFRYGFLAFFFAMFFLLRLVSRSRPRVIKQVTRSYRCRDTRKGQFFVISRTKKT